MFGQGHNIITEYYKMQILAFIIQVIVPDNDPRTNPVILHSIYRAQPTIYYFL